MPVNFSRLQHGAREVRVIDSIRIVLGFKAEASVASVSNASFTIKGGLWRVGEVEASVELETGLVAVNFEVPA